MVKYYNSMVVFEEIPDEITLAINITNCPCRCIECHSKFLWEDTGTELSFSELDRLIKINDGITCICFMGGDANPKEINILAKYIKKSRQNKLKTAWYSGRDTISSDISLENFDFIKIGHFDGKYGGLNKPTTNQILYKVNDKKELVNITYNFWKKEAK